MSGRSNHQEDFTIRVSLNNDIFFTVICSPSDRISTLITEIENCLDIIATIDKSTLCQECREYGFRIHDLRNSLDSPVCSDETIDSRFNHYGLCTIQFEAEYMAAVNRNHSNNCIWHITIKEELSYELMEKYAIASNRMLFDNFITNIIERRSRNIAKSQSPSSIVVDTSAAKNGKWIATSETTPAIQGAIYHLDGHYSNYQGVDATRSNGFVSTSNNTYTNNTNTTSNANSTNTTNIANNANSANNISSIVNNAGSASIINDIRSVGNAEGKAILDTDSSGNPLTSQQQQFYQQKEGAHPSTKALLIESDSTLPDKTTGSAREDSTSTKREGALSAPNSNRTMPKQSYDSQQKDATSNAFNNDVSDSTNNTITNNRSRTKKNGKLKNRSSPAEQKGNTSSNEGGSANSRKNNEPINVKNGAKQKMLGKAKRGTLRNSQIQEQTDENNDDNSDDDEYQYDDNYEDHEDANIINESESKGKKGNKENKSDENDENNDEEGEEEDEDEDEDEDYEYEDDENSQEKSNKSRHQKGARLQRNDSDSGIYDVEIGDKVTITKCKPYCKPLAAFGDCTSVCPKCGEVKIYAPTEGEKCTQTCRSTDKSCKPKTLNLDVCCICTSRYRQSKYKRGYVHQCKTCRRPWLVLNSEGICRSCHQELNIKESFKQTPPIIPDYQKKLNACVIARQKKILAVKR